MAAEERSLQAVDNQPVSASAVVGQMWTAEDRKLIHETVAQGTSTSEFKLFLYTAAKYQLDPLVKQVWCVKYGNDPAQIFTGRDGFLSIAHRSGQFDGMESGVRVEQMPIAVEYYDKRSKKRVMGVKRDFQYVGWCKVYRKDMKHPFLVEVWEEEYSTGRNLWQDKPRTMIQKVAESQCLRRAFDISGLYSPEEMDTDSFEQPRPVQDVKAETVSEQGQKKTEQAEPSPENGQQARMNERDKERFVAILNQMGQAMKELGVEPTDVVARTRLLKSINARPVKPTQYTLDEAIWVTEQLQDLVKDKHEMERPDPVPDAEQASLAIDMDSEDAVRERVPF